MDGDVIIYQAAAKYERVTEWPDETLTVELDRREAKQAILERLAYIEKELELDSIIFCLSDYNNFRKDSLPTYKFNRLSRRGPIGG